MFEESFNLGNVTRPSGFRMACNGHNHPKDCCCNFRGGHPNSQPPRPPAAASLLGSLAPPSRKREQSPIICRTCGQQVFYRRGSAEGSGYVLAGDGSKQKHRCPRRPPENKIRIRKDRSRRGWLEATLKAVAHSGIRQQLEITSLVEGKPITVEVIDDRIVDVAKPTFYRTAPDDHEAVELGYPTESGEMEGPYVRARRLG